MKAHYDLKNPRENPFAERMKNGYRIIIEREPVDETDISIINEMKASPVTRNLFHSKAIPNGGSLPFELKQPRYNAETEAAMRECDEMLASGNYISYSSAKEMHEAIFAEDEDDDV